MSDTSNDGVRQRTVTSENDADDKRGSSSASSGKEVAIFQEGSQGTATSSDDNESSVTTSGDQDEGVQVPRTIGLIGGISFIVGTIIGK